MKEQPAKRGPPVIHKKYRRMPSSAEFDVCVCGGTLGIFVATSLQVHDYQSMALSGKRTNVMASSQHKELGHEEDLMPLYAADQCC